VKLTLFTISNEQIKEQLSKLQTKVESLETVKDVQDKIISAKDSQITFLQGEISSIVTWVTWGAGIVITLASAAFIFIKLLENKAKKKIEEAENALQSATQQLAQIEIAKQETETNLTKSNEKINQLNSLIDESNNIATIAQEKLENLEEKQHELTLSIHSVTTNQKADVQLKSISFTLNYIIKAIQDIKTKINENYFEATQSNENKILSLAKKHDQLLAKSIFLETSINQSIKLEQIVSDSILNNLENLEIECRSFSIEVLDCIEEIFENNKESK
jgi:DNA repair exonuclease SbcCD ATPase subunit